MARHRTWACVPLGLIGLLGACAVGPERSLSPQERAAQLADETSTPRAGETSTSEAADISAQPVAEHVAGEVDSAAPAAGAEDQTICRTEVVTGTHRPTTVCLTRAERRAMRDAAQDWYRSGGRDGAVSQIPVVR